MYYIIYKHSLYFNHIYLTGKSYNFKVYLFLIENKTIFVHHLQHGKANTGKTHRYPAPLVALNTGLYCLIVNLHLGVCFI